MSWRSQRGEMNLSLGGGNGELASGEDSSVPLTRKQCGIRNDLRFLTLRNLGNYSHRIKIESQAIFKPLCVLANLAPLICHVLFTARSSGCPVTIQWVPFLHSHVLHPV